MSKKNTTTTIHLSEEIFEYLNELRKKEFISVSKYIDNLVHIAKEKKE